MNDSEMLKFAAKASGIEVVCHGNDFFTAKNGISIDEWNPLADDGDALRLAVKLNLWEVVRKAHRLLGAPDCPDMYAAARHAITIAAAEIGKAMP